MTKEKTVCLDIPKLGGVQDFNIRTKSSTKDRYVYSTWTDDGLDNDGNWDILHDPVDQEYYAIKA